MKRKILSILIALASVLFSGQAVSYAAFSKADAGTSTAQFLKLGAGARATGMGNVYVGLVDDANAVYWNPAGLRGVDYRSMAFMHVPWMEEVNYDWFAYAQDFRELGTFGVGFQYMSYGLIDATNDIGAKTGTLSPSDSALTLSYARDIVPERLQMGVSLKYISTKLQDSASTIAADLGAMYWVPETNLSLGAVVTNLGTGMKFISQESPLPSAVKFGGAYDLNKDWLVAMDIVFPNDNDPNAGIGTEYRIKQFSLRTGYNTRTKDIGGVSGLTLGLGFKYKDFSFDYSFEFYDYMDDVSRFSIVWKCFR